jgi:hypothetical protein
MPFETSTWAAALIAVQITLIISAAERSSAGSDIGTSRTGTTETQLPLRSLLATGTTWKALLLYIVTRGA